MDSLNATYPARWVGYCTCAGWGPGHLHELACGWDIDDSDTDADAAGPTAALPYAGVPR